MTTMSKLSIEKMTQSKKMENNLINNSRNWSTMLLISTKKTKTLPSESTCKTLRKRTENSFNESCVVILDDTIRTCLNFNRWKRMKKIDLKECKKWWSGWDADKMTKKDSMLMIPKMKMIKRTFITIIMVTERELIISKKLLLNIMRNNLNNKTSNKFNKNLDTSLWILSRQLKTILSNPSLLNCWRNCLKCSKKLTNLLINLLPSLILVWTNKKIIKKSTKVKNKRRIKTLLAIFSLLDRIKEKQMV